MMQTPPRPLAERRAAAEARLNSDHQLWLATSSTKPGAHLIPISFVWDGQVLTLVTFANTKTAQNLRSHPVARAALGSTQDVVVVDGDVAFVGTEDVDQETADRIANITMDPRQIPGLVYFQLAPQRILVWNGFHEFGGRTVMHKGQWLDEPID